MAPNSWDQIKCIKRWDLVDMFEQSGQNRHVKIDMSKQTCQNRRVKIDRSQLKEWSKLVKIGLIWSNMVQN